MEDPFNRSSQPKLSKIFLTIRTLFLYLFHFLCKCLCAAWCHAYLEIYCRRMGNLSIDVCLPYAFLVLGCSQSFFHWQRRYGLLKFCSWPGCFDLGGSTSAISSGLICSSRWTIRSSFSVRLVLRLLFSLINSPLSFLRISTSSAFFLFVELTVLSSFSSSWIKLILPLTCFLFNLLHSPYVFLPVYSWQRHVSNFSHLLF